MNPWFVRSHAFHGGTGAGVFASNAYYGSVNTYDSFRELTKTTQIPVIKI